MWQPDGWGARARIGLLMPHFDIGPEAEFAAMAPDGVTIHSTRVPLGVAMPGSATDPGIALAPERASPSRLQSMMRPSSSLPHPSIQLPMAFSAAPTDIRLDQGEKPGPSPAVGGPRQDLSVTMDAADDRVVAPVAREAGGARARSRALGAKVR